jgi:AcrR family transcriptional regulator
MVALTKQAIVEAGVDIARSGGWAALSLRSVAGNLGVTPMALYRHVADAETLSNAVLESIATLVATVERTVDPWADVSLWARSSRLALRPFPGVPAHLLTAWFNLAPMLSLVEDLLDRVHDAGLAEFEAVAAVNAVFMFVLMRAEAEQTVRTAGVARRALRLSTAGRDLPRLRTLSSHYTTAEFDRHFEYGLDVLIAGIRARGTST